MKRLIAFAASFISVFLFVFSSSAAEFSMYSDGVTYNRIFTLRFYLTDETASFCSVLFEVDYNPGIVEFRGIASPISDAILDSYDNENGKVSVIFLVTEPLDCRKTSEILSLKFIPKSTGNGSFKVNFKEAININGNPLDFNNTLSCPFSVSGNKKNLTVSSIKSNNFTISTNSSQPSESDTLQESSDNSDTSDNSDKNEETIILEAVADGRKQMVAITVVILFVFGAFLAEYAQVKRKIKKDNEKKNKNKNKNKDEK